MEALWKQAELRMAGDSGRRRCDLVHAEWTGCCHLDLAREDRTTPVSVVHRGGHDRAVQGTGRIGSSPPPRLPRCLPLSRFKTSGRSIRRAGPRRSGIVERGRLHALREPHSLARTLLIVGRELPEVSWRLRCAWIGDELRAEEPVAAELVRASALQRHVRYGVNGTVPP
jgi:hypothetical protein